ncbi:MAG: TIGR03617 family F420-dependent LLM class oxidoreductase [Acidimicrobiia bacterium]|jgi:probable F420-dependent oxidoreductase
MKVDFYYPPLPPGPAPAMARRAANLGYDGFFTAETGHEPFLPLALASQAAPDLDLGTAVAVAFPRSPMVTAQMAWDLASLSGGKFLLGLGTQVKPHITRRFSTDWQPAAPRLREYIQAMRAIWQTFQHGTELDFAGDYYRFSLMTPFFSGGPIEHPHIPVLIAGVGPVLARLAGELCDGFHVHPFHTVRYLDEVVLPAISAGARRAGRDPHEIEKLSTVFVVTGRDDGEVAAAARPIRQQIAFYASTPSYAPVLDVHGWDFGTRLNTMSRLGEWDAMADVITAEVLEEVAIVAPVDEVGRRIRERYGDRLQRVGFYALGGDGALTDEEWAALVVSTRA